MNLSVLIKDIVLCFFWLAIRSIPFFLLLWSVSNMSEDAPWFIKLIMHSIAFGLPFMLVTWITVAVPAIVWRYRNNHQTQLVEFDGRNYRQVKILGMWFFIKMSDNGVYYNMSSNHWFTTDHLVESSNDSYKFTNRFETFINAWRFGETSEVLKYQTFEGGRSK